MERQIQQSPESPLCNGAPDNGTAGHSQDGDVMVAVNNYEDTKDAAQIAEAAATTGRIYHDEHWVMGTYVGHGPAIAMRTTEAGNLDASPTKDLDDGDRRTARGLMHKPTTTLLHANTGVLGAPSVGLPAPAPMPKWPANWQSAAFEAVAVKKSYILSPPEIYAECAHHGEEKAKFSWYKMMVLSTIAGCYVGFGYTTCLQIGGMMDQRPSNPDTADVNPGVFRALFGAMGFPFGFATIVVCGAELYTSLCAYTTCAMWEGKIGPLTALRMLAMSWCGNFLGCVIMVGLFYAAGTYEHGRAQHAVWTAEDKMKYTWGQVFVKGIFANWLVGIATWMANAAQDLTGKFVGIWLPISAFAAIGFEHCIANQFLLPLAIAYGADISAKQFVWDNLIPSTLGNWVGGAVCVATTYAMVYGRTPLLVGRWWDNSVAPRLPWGEAKKAR